MLPVDVRRKWIRCVFNEMTWNLKPSERSQKWHLINLFVAEHVGFLKNGDEVTYICNYPTCLRDLDHPSLPNQDFTGAFEGICFLRHRS